ncbi:MAG: C2H2-type zinc finger protein [Dehalococcoidia bacterium]|nr:MAG: C2H2-type zinc finger protein [Dehalococcoidia bacterium]
MFKCKECGKEFADWHALGGHMRTHWSRRKEGIYVQREVEPDKVVIGNALEKLSELSPEEAWQIVVNWIMEVYGKERQREETIQTYRLQAQKNEKRIDAIQGELRKLQQMVVGEQSRHGMERLL